MNYKNILIIKLSAIGDVIHALPVAGALKERWPDARITWIVEKPAYDLLTNNPAIDEIIIFDKPKFKTAGGLFTNGRELAGGLKQRHFDLAIDLQGLFKSAAISYLSGAPERVVYCNARELSYLVGRRLCGPNAGGHVVDRYLDVARALGCEVSRVEFGLHITAAEAAAAETAAATAGLPTGAAYVVLAPGTNWPNKCWPPGHFARLADRLAALGLTTVLVGGPKDKPRAAEIIAQAQHPPLALLGRTSLKQLAYLIKQARAFVGGDTGPMHLAAAVGTPVVALFGPTDPQRNGPYGTGHQVLTVPQDCAGCWQRQCPKNRDCLTGIDVNTVFEATRSLLK